MEIQNFTNEYDSYLKDESKSIGTAEYIAFPKSAGDVKEALSWAYENAIPVTVQGERTGLAAGASPRGGLILSLQKMNKVISFREESDSSEAFVTVQPGLVLSELNRQVAENTFGFKGHYFFTPDPTETSASIGGMVSCNASGAKSFCYGPTRNHVNAVTMILPDGRTISEKRGGNKADGLNAVFTCDDGSKLNVKLPSYVMPKTKNASGYFVAPDMELIDLLIGSDGTLGVITEIEVRLLPKPQNIWGISALFVSEEDSLKFTDTLRKKNLSGIACMEFFDKGALNILRKQKASGNFTELYDIPDDITNIIYVELHKNSEDECYETVETLMEVLEECGGDSDRTWLSMDGAGLATQKLFRHAVPESVNMLIGERKKTYPAITKLGSDMSVPNDKLFEVLSFYRESLKENNLESAAWGHIGNNHIHVNVLPRNMEEFTKTKELFKSWAKVISQMGGAVSAEHGVGKIKADFLRIMYGDKAISEMQSLKENFDSKWLLGRENMFPTK